MKKRIIFWLIGWAIIYAVFFQVLPYLTDRYHGCYIHQDVYAQSIKSVVFKKFIDHANHNEKTIVYLENNREKSMIFTPEFYGMYDFIDVTDSIIKNINSVNYRVKNKTTGKDTTMKFDTTCKDSLNKK
ncbi:hypothetical protein G7092_03575 [Mucilaginibacter sp. HC2]|uniref:hypothetical protein n=1 Tax=Mucilaginibacter inviolabilis TaxID=2714892 RepID=UPI00140DCCC9|nr:hypothetical protein [Mucilaginibacter inviolabilis]NHA02855.1 hypothetical protein [Mucilaginibacter inviolabilis]